VYKYWEMIGNNCESIRLQSLTTGVKATVRMNSGTIASDFVQMSDQKTNGTVQFFAGAHSTNIGTTNNGWRFESPFNLKDVGFLGRDTVFCNATALQLKALTSNIATYKWSTNATTSSIYVTTPGEYRAEITYTNNCVIRDTILIEQVNLAPFELGADTLLCQNEKVTLRMPYVEGATYAWQDGKTTPQYEVSNAGVYTGEIRLKGCKVSDFAAVKFVEVGSLNLGRDTTLCEGQTLNLGLNVGTGTTYLWQDGSRTPQYSITKAGLYWVEIGNNNCKIRDSIRVDFGNTVNFDIGPDKNLCEGESTILKANVPNAQFQWQDGSTTSTFKVTQAGVYSVVASVGTCRSADTVIVGYKPLPTIDLGNDTAVCVGNSVMLTAQAQTGATLRWDNTRTDATRLVISKGKYKIWATLNGCTQVDSINVDIKPLPSLNLGSDTTVCGSIVYQLQSHSNANRFKWQDGSNQSTYRVTQSGQYLVEATLNGCSKTDTVQVNINPLPTVELGNDTTLCEGNSLMLTANSQTGATFRWGNNMETDYCLVQSKGKYKVTVSLNGCTQTDSINVGFNPIPILELGRDTNVCGSITYLLKSSSNARIFKWQDGSTLANYRVSQSGKYTVEATLNGCSKMDTVQVLVTDYPTFELGKDTVLCGGKALTLNANVKNGTFKWYDNSTANSLMVTKSNIYTAEANNSGCIFRDTIKVTFSTPPQYSLGRDTSICRYDTVTLHINVPNSNISWYNQSKKNVLSITEEGTYWADVVSKEGCTFRDSIKVLVETCIPFKPYVPNVFSPNDDGVNDDVKPFFQNEFQITDNYLFQIYNRWGECVFTTTDKTAAWDGRCRNQSIDNGVFVYMVKLTYKDFKGAEKKATLAGDITLLR
jgi:gliding motility-associated-like protein